MKASAPRRVSDLAGTLAAAAGPAVSAAQALSMRAAAAARAAVAAWLSRLAAPFFRPDAVAAPDPLAPDPAVPADALAESLRLAAREGTAVRLLLAPAPGTDFEIGLLSATSEITVLCAGSAATRPVPRFSTGVGPSVLHLRGDGDGIRLVLEPVPRGVLVRRWPLNP